MTTKQGKKFPATLAKEMKFNIILENSQTSADNIQVIVLKSCAWCQGVYAKASLCPTEGPIRADPSYGLHMT